MHKLSFAGIKSFGEEQRLLCFKADNSTDYLFLPVSYADAGLYHATRAKGHSGAPQRLHQVLLDLLHRLGMRLSHVDLRLLPHAPSTSPCPTPLANIVVDRKEKGLLFLPCAAFDAMLLSCASGAPLLADGALLKACKADWEKSGLPHPLRAHISISPPQQKSTSTPNAVISQQPVISKSSFATAPVETGKTTPKNHKAQLSVLRPLPDGNFELMADGLNLDSDIAEQLVSLLQQELSSDKKTEPVTTAQTKSGIKVEIIPGKISPAGRNTKIVTATETSELRWSRMLHTLKPETDTKM